MVLSEMDLQVVTTETFVVRKGYQKDLVFKSYSTPYLSCKPVAKVLQVQVTESPLINTRSVVL